MSNVSDYFESDIPVGGSMPFWGVEGAIPNGFLLCNGAVLNIADYPRLASLLGIIYGGDGVTTFGLPDARGRVVAGLDNMGGVAAGVIIDPAGSALGGTLGNEKVSLNSAELAAHAHTGGTEGAGSHTHPGSTAIAVGDHQHTGGTVADGDQSTTGGQASGTFAPTSPAGAHGHNLTIATDGFHGHNFTTNSFGSGDAHNNVQPTIFCNQIIRAR